LLFFKDITDPPQERHKITTMATLESSKATPWKAPPFAIEAYLHLDQFQPARATIYCRTRDLNYNWTFSMDHHDLFVKLTPLLDELPEKLSSLIREGGDYNSIMYYYAEALVSTINHYQGHLSNFNYTTSTSSRQSPLGTKLFSFTHLNFKVSEGGSDLATSLAEYTALVECFKSKLIYPTNALQIRATGEQLLVQSDVIHRCCRVVNDFLYPYWMSATENTKLPADLTKNLLEKVGVGLVNTEPLHLKFLKMTEANAPFSENSIIV